MLLNSGICLYIGEYIKETTDAATFEIDVNWEQHLFSFFKTKTKLFWFNKETKQQHFIPK